MSESLKRLLESNDSDEPRHEKRAESAKKSKRQAEESQSGSESDHDCHESDSELLLNKSNPEKDDTQVAQAQSDDTLLEEIAQSLD